MEVSLANEKKDGKIVAAFVGALHGPLYYQFRGIIEANIWFKTFKWLIVSLM